LTTVWNGEQLWRLTVENSPVGLALVAPDGRMMTANRALCEMLGRSEDEIRGLTFQELTHPDDLDQDLELVRQALDGEHSSYRLRKRYLHASGRVVWGDLSVALLRGDDGTPLHFISQILDVTAEQEFADRLEHTTNALEHQHRRLEAVLDAADVALVVLDRNGGYEITNRSHRKLQDLAFPDGHHGLVDQVGSIFAEDGVTRLESHELPSVRAAAGEEFDDVRVWMGEDPATRRAISVSARPIHGPDGRLSGAVMASTDVTDFVRAVEIKDDFVAHVSHELRTPLTSILGYLEILLDTPGLPARVGGHLAIVERNAVRLQDLVKDLLQTVHVTDGSLELARTEVDLRQLCFDAVDSRQRQAGRGGVDLVADLPEAPLLASVDGPLFRQVVDNLLSNAIKYSTDGGTITVSIRRTDDGRDIVLTVADTGIGISPEELDHLYTRFFRGDHAQMMMLPGAGLGLSIVRAIVEAHGGRIDVESAVGEGSTFRVTMPYVPA